MCGPWQFPNFLFMLNRGFCFSIHIFPLATLSRLLWWIDNSDSINTCPIAMFFNHVLRYCIGFIFITYIHCMWMVVSMCTCSCLTYIVGIDFTGFRKFILIWVLIILLFYFYFVCVGGIFDLIFSKIPFLIFLILTIILFLIFSF